jgi:hypothetical protein
LKACQTCGFLPFLDIFMHCICGCKLCNEDEELASNHQHLLDLERRLQQGRLIKIQRIQHLNTVRKDDAKSHLTNKIGLGVEKDHSFAKQSTMTNISQITNMWCQ